MALAASPINERKRVKVYELKESDWWDRGTGFCTVQTILQDETLFVESEDNGRPLLQTKVEKEHNYQKQQGADTLIVWTDTDGLDMALSFQEAEGCSLVWSTINEVQQRLGGEFVFPPVDLAHLGDIEAMTRSACLSNQSRETFVRRVEAENYLGRLVPLVEMAEDLESLPDLHKLCNIFKSLILLNDTKLIEDSVRDDNIMGVVGALEYDPDFPEHKANHRQYLSDKTKFKEVVKIDDENVRRRIHATFRLQYLKDVVLARVLDDPTFTILNSLIYFHQIEIVQHIAHNGPLIKEILSVITSPDQLQRNKKDAVLFIQQCTSISKTAQPAIRAGLYQNLINGGLFSIIGFALQNLDASVRVAGVDIFLTIIDHDAIMMRNMVFKSVTEKSKPMTETLVDLFLAEPDLGVKAQVCDAIKILLEPSNAPNSVDRAALGGDGNFVARLRSSPIAQQNDQHLAAFFEGSAKKLFQPLKDLQKRDDFKNLGVHEVALYGHLVEILSFFLKQQSHRSKLFILTENLAARVAQLIAAPQKHLKLIAVKYFRAVISLNDEHHNRQLVRDKLFEPILNILIETLPRDNLLNSACLELFEVIRKDNIKPFIIHLVESYRDRLESITIRGISTFPGLVLRYDQLINPHLVPATGPTEGDSSFMTSDAETPNTRHVTINGGGGRWQGIKDNDAEEDAYFNASDGEEDDEDELSRDIHSSNGLFNASPLSKPLVDYADDEDDDMITASPLADDSITPSKRPPFEDIDSSPMTASPSASSLASASTAATTVPASSTPPPQSITEKRRREDEDEEDELDKLSSGTSKRRNSGKFNIKSTTATIDNDEQSPREVTATTAPRTPPSKAESSDTDTTRMDEKEKEDSKFPHVVTPIRRTPSLKRKAGFTLNRTRSGSESKKSDGESGEGPPEKKGKIAISLGKKH